MECQKRAVICNFAQSGQKYCHERMEEEVEKVKLAHLLGDSGRIQPSRPSVVRSNGEFSA